MSVIIVILRPSTYSNRPNASIDKATMSDESTTMSGTEHVLDLSKFKDNDFRQGYNFTWALLRRPL